MMNTRTTGRVSGFAAALLAGAVLVAGAAGPAYAADPTTEAPAKPAAKVAKDQLYCVIDTPTGSHLRKKECHTRADWIARTGVDPAGEARK
jgi:hypothetical protein